MGVMAGAFSPLPDKIDRFCGVYGRKLIKLFNHREHSHYWGYWALIAVFSYLHMKEHGYLLIDWSDYIRVFQYALVGDISTAWAYYFPNIAFWGSIGSLFHIFEDFFSGMGVPIVFPNKLSPHIHLYTGGGFSEYLVAILASTACFLAYWYPTPMICSVQKLFWDLFL